MFSLSASIFKEMHEKVFMLHRKLKLKKIAGSAIIYVIKIIYCNI